ncbi:MAG: hypothetical protein D6760_01055 [Deltaproteobacteria bacterium]|nr:MAG: hypothetical protein D6760_01055 [Deltaproteobacteria bacterium]
MADAGLAPRAQEPIPERGEARSGGATRWPNPVRLKLELLVRGVRLSRRLAREGLLAPLQSARDLAGRDIEIVLPEGIVARCPVGTRASKRSPFLLDADEAGARLIRDEGPPVPVRIATPPRFYRMTTRAGTPMWQVGTVHAGFISIDPAPACGLAARGLGCAFCTLARGSASDGSARPVDEVLEVVSAAFAEGAADFVYFNTGYYEAEDGGFRFLEPYIAAVRKYFDTLIAVQLHPPRDDRWIDRTYAAGADAVSYSLEVFDAAALERFCRGRSELIGRERYVQALARAARIFPSGAVWSDLIVGLEPAESTRQAIDNLTSIGVLPVLSPFRPLEETPLRNHPAPEPDQLEPLYAYLYEKVREARINLQYLRDLGGAITPIEARFFAGDAAKLDVAASGLLRSKLGARAVRSLAALRRRLRVRRVSDSFDASHL